MWFFSFELVFGFGFVFVFFVEGFWEVVFGMMFLFWGCFVCCLGVGCLSFVVVLGGWGWCGDIFEYLWEGRFRKC